jgi:DNA-binding MarR family transcriptional regulator
MIIAKKLNTASVPMRSLHPLDHALELLHFGFRGLTVQADLFLATRDLSRVHHRILYIIARADDINVGDLAMTLGVSKQGLHRPLKHLFDQALVTYTRAPQQHRFKILTLTEEGQRVEQTATEHERQLLDRALRDVGETGQQAWTSVMTSLAENLN